MTDDTPTLEDALDGLQIAVRYASHRDLDIASDIADNYQALANQAPNDDWSTYDDPPRTSSAAEWAQHDPGEQERILDLAADARLLFDSCPECGGAPTKKHEDDDTILRCEHGHTWEHDP